MTPRRTAIITRTKNRPLLLRRAAESVLGQTDQDYIWVIVNDGGSSEAVGDVLAPHLSTLGDRLQRIDLPTSVGMEAASNCGIRASASRYLVIHDDDDTWAPEFLARTTATLEAKPFAEVAAAVTLVTEVREHIADDLVIEDRRQPYNNHLHNLLLSNFLRENPTPPISFLYERQVHDRIGFYDESLRVLGDWEFFLRFYSRHEAILIREALANYHIRPAASGQTYGNSVTAGIDQHALHHQILWNSLLRRDLESGRMGLGSLIAMTQNMQRQHSAPHPLQSLLLPLLAMRLAGHREFVACGAGALAASLPTLADSLGMRLRCFTDRSPERQGSQIQSIPVCSLPIALPSGLPCLVASVLHGDSIAHDIAATAQDLRLPIPEIYRPHPLP